MVKVLIIDIGLHFTCGSWEATISHPDFHPNALQPLFLIGNETFIGSFHLTLQQMRYHFQKEQNT